MILNKKEQFEIDKNELLDHLNNNSLLYSGPNTDFILKSGKKSKYLFDIKRTALTATGIGLLQSVLVHYMDEYFPETEVVAGVELGGCPLATIVSFDSVNKTKQIDCLYVRKEPKDHGTGNLIEGVTNKNKVLLIEDVITTGNSSLKAIKALQQHSYNVIGVLSVVDRDEGSKDNFANANIRCRSIFSFDEVMNYKK